MQTFSQYLMQLALLLMTILIFVGMRRSITFSKWEKTALSGLICSLSSICTQYYWKNL